MEQFPKTIYKYRDWTSEHSKNVLLKSQLFLASPGSFNDPFDCRIPVNYSTLTKDQINLISQNLSEGQPDIGSDPKTLQEQIAHDLEFHNARFQFDANEIFYQEYDKHMGVLSMSSSWENILLWSHYADNHKGYCIGFNEKKLTETGVFGTWGLVQYPEGNEFPVITPFTPVHERFFINVFHKSQLWAYEREYRLAKIFRPGIPTIGDRITTFDPSFIDEVIVGQKMSQEHRTEITQFCINHSIPVYEALPRPFHFEIDRNRLY